VIKQQNVWHTLMMQALTVMYTAGFKPIEPHNYTHRQQSKYCLLHQNPWQQNEPQWSKKVDKKVTSSLHMDSSVVYLSDVANVHHHMLPWSHLSPYPKWHLDQFSRFCAAHGRRFIYFTTGHPYPPQYCPCAREIWTPI